MKVHRVTLQHFKRFEDRTFSFLDARGLPRDLVVLVGENGCGKSTVLQAIAATLGTATGRLSSPGELRWPGFDFDIIGRAWDLAPRVDLTLSFVAQPGAPLGIRMEGMDLFDRDTIQGARGAGESIYWYTEQRLPGSVQLGEQRADEHTPVSLDILRSRLAQYQYFHTVVLASRPLRKGERDRYGELDRHWKAVFPGRNFEGVSIGDQPEAALEQPRFYLTDPTGHPYEIGEMSGAERAIFPLIFDFANWNIHNSVILIDELELHLHPPLQQALLRALPRLGNNNQFIITTHSDHIASLVDPGAILRVD